MKESSNFEVSNEGNRFIREIAELDKNLELKSNKLERLKCLRSELSGGKLYVKYCKNRIEMEESIHEYEKEYPSGPDYPLPTDLPPDKKPSVNHLPAPIPEKIIKPFPEFLVHIKRDELADKLKSEFKSEKGIPIRLMIEVLRSYDPPLIAVSTNEKTELCNSLKAYFNRDTGSRQGIFPSGFNISYYEDDLNSTKAKVDFILESI